MGAIRESSSLPRCRGWGRWRGCQRGASWILVLWEWSLAFWEWLLELLERILGLREWILELRESLWVVWG